MKHSAGIIPYKVNEDGKLLFFLGHPGGYHINKWAYLKGGIEENEDKKDAALREFHEESGINVDSFKDDLVYLGEIQQNISKVVSAYALDTTGKIEIDPEKCYSNLCDKGWPEMDEYAWMDFGQVVLLSNTKHFPFYKKIINIVGEHNEH